MGKIAKGVNKINFTMLYLSYVFIFSIIIIAILLHGENFMVIFTTLGVVI